MPVGLISDMARVTPSRRLGVRTRATVDARLEKPDLRAPRSAWGSMTIPAAAPLRKLLRSMAEGWRRAMLISWAAERGRALPAR
jgi:hypothetical protein